MDVITTARHFELTPEIREHAEKRVEKLQRYLGGVDEIHVTLATEKYRQIAEIALHARGTEVVSRGVSDEMLVSIDRVVDRIERQLQRLHARHKRNRKLRRTPRTELAPQSGPRPDTAIDDVDDGEDSDLILDADNEFSPVVVRSDHQCHPSPLSVEDAIEIVRKQNGDFLMFTNTKTQKVALVFVRQDGNYGLVEMP